MNRREPGGAEGGRGTGPRGMRVKAAAAVLAVVASTAGVAGLAAITVPGAATAKVSAVPAAAAPSTVPTAPPGFSLTWSDDFTGAAGTGPDPTNWKYDTGPGSSFGTGEIETMTNSTANVYQDGSGHLVLKALHTGSNPASGWTSGRIETQAATFGAPPGGVVEMQASIQQPDLTTANGAGYWPAFWMLGSTLRTGTPWPMSGEVDILEDINSRSSVFGTLHCGTDPGGPCNETTGIGSGEHPCPGCQTGNHTYAVQIDRSVSPEQIRWYLDGTNYFTVSANQVDPATWANAVDHPFFIIFDLAMGGGFPNAFGGGPNSSTASGGQLNVDYVAVYNKPPGGGGDTTPPSAPNGLTAAGTTATSTSLAWGASTDNVGVSGYDVLRNGATVTTVTGTSYSATGLSPSTTYTFQVKARDAAGNLSAGSNTVSVTTSASGGGGGANIAQGKPATASSVQDGSLPAADAVDGNTATRWSSAFSDPQWLQVDLGQTYNISHVTLNWEAAYARAFQIQTSNDGTMWTTIYSTTTGTGGVQDLAVTGTGRYIRMYGTARATQYGYSLWEFSVNGSPATGSGTLLSQGRPATASSLENGSFPAADAVDGNTGTRWSSGFSDPQWLEVDLGAAHAISQVVLNWEAAYGKAFQIQTSNDGTTWTTIYSTTTGTGGVQTIPVSGTGRYVRLYGTQRATQYGYSLWEFQVFGS
jgi:beta-glucanase (GH16 family)